MSADIAVHFTSGDDDDDDDISDSEVHLMAFCMQLVHQSQWKSGRIFLSGISSEIPLSRAVAQKLRVSVNTLDSLLHFSLRC